MGGFLVLQKRYPTGGGNEQTGMQGTAAIDARPILLRREVSNRQFGCLRNLIFKVIFSAFGHGLFLYFYQNYFKILL